MANTPYYVKAETEALISALRKEGVIGIKAAIISTSAAPTEDGLFPCADTGTYTDFGGLDVNVSNTIVFISVSQAQTVFVKVPIPITLTIESTAIDGSVNAIQSNAVFDIKAALDTAIALKQDALTFQSIPTEDSTDIVRSGGIYSELIKKPNLVNISNNLFNVLTDIVDGSYLSNSGVFQSAVDWGRSILLPCVEGDKINVDGVFGREGFAFYSDSSGTVVSGSYVADNQGQKVAPATALFYAFNIYQQSDQNYSNVMVNIGDTALPYEAFALKVRKENLEQYAEIAGDLEVLKDSEKLFKGKKISDKLDEKLSVDEITSKLFSSNLFNVLTDVVADSGIDNNGIIQSTAGYTDWGRSKVFPCVAGELIHVQGTFGRERFVFYSDELGQNVVQNNASNTGVKTAPATALFYAFLIYQQSNQNFSNIMLNKGAVALPFVAFGFIYQIKESALPNDGTYLEMSGEGNDVTVVGKKSTRVLEALRNDVIEQSRVFNFKTDKIGTEIIRENTLDDVAPSHFLGTTLLANHSYYGYSVGATSHGKTSADIGSIFSNNGNNFVLINIVDVDNIWIIDEVLGDNLIDNSTLVYVSGGSNTSNITIQNATYRQAFPCSQDYGLDIFVDGFKKIEKTGKFFYSDKVVFQETYNLITRDSIINWYKNSYDGSLNPTGELLIFNSIDYTFDIDGNCTIPGDYTFNDILQINDIMGIQAVKVTALDKYYIPKTIEFTFAATQLNFSMLEDSTTATDLGAGSINFTPSRLDASAISSDRWLQVASDGTKGFAMGFLPIGASGTNRATNVTQFACEIRGNTDKVYPRLVEKGDFNSTVGESYSYIAYRNVFIPENGATANYAVRTNGDDFYYIDYHNTQSLKQFEMPTDFIGRKFEIVEQRNITCNQSIISNKLTVNVDCLVDYGYLVLKINK